MTTLKNVRNRKCPDSLSRGDLDDFVHSSFNSRLCQAANLIEGLVRRTRAKVLRTCRSVCGAFLMRPSVNGQVIEEVLARAGHDPRSSRQGRFANGESGHCAGGRMTELWLFMLSVFPGWLGW